jgi:TRAP-type C4-dicarboxylate transport system permease small subunit
MRDFLEEWVSRVAAFVLAGAVVLMSLQIFFRLVFNAPLTWTEEVDRYLFVWLVYLGSAVAVAKKAHIRVMVLIDLGGPKWHSISNLVENVSCILAFPFAAYFGFRLAYDSLNARFYTLDFMPLVIFYLAAPIGMLLMLIFALWPTKKEKPTSNIV